MRKRCLDCRQIREVYGQICEDCVRGYYRREKNRAIFPSKLNRPIEQTPRARARACLYFRPANVTFSESEQE